MTALNQKITDLEITDATMSEVTRLFLSAHGEVEVRHRSPFCGFSVCLCGNTRQQAVCSHSMDLSSASGDDKMNCGRLRFMRRVLQTGFNA